LKGGVDVKRQMLGRCPICTANLDITRLHCPSCNTAIEGKFDPCKFCRLPLDQQEFIEVFIKCRGNIKEVEKELGISYPTVRGRLEAVIESLGYRPEPIPKTDPEVARKRKEVLDALNKGEITAEEAVALLKKV
jgi:hypothetical protein